MPVEINIGKRLEKQLWHNQFYAKNPAVFWLPEGLVVWRDYFSEQVNNFMVKNNISSETFVEGYSDRALEVTFNKSTGNVYLMNRFPPGFLAFDELVVLVKTRYPDAVEHLRHSCRVVLDNGSAKYVGEVWWIKPRDEDYVTVSFYDSEGNNFAGEIAAPVYAKNTWHDVYLTFDLKEMKYKYVYVDFIDFSSAWEDAGYSLKLYSTSSDGKKRVETYFVFWSDGSSAETITAQICDIYIIGVGGIVKHRSKIPSYPMITV